MTGFRPFISIDRPCRWCRYWGAWLGKDRGMVLCNSRPPHVHVAVETGCAFWEREPGTDDDAASASPEE